ncbi:MAG: hypothetical protein V3U26_02010, partial [Dehalococcoidia bacterium]
WLLSFYWHVDWAYSSLAELTQHRDEGQLPTIQVLRALQQVYEAGLTHGLELRRDSYDSLHTLGIRAGS